MKGRLSQGFFKANPYISAHYDGFLLHSFNTKTKAIFNYEWMPIAILTKNSGYLFSCSLYTFNIAGMRCSSMIEHLLMV